ncbi:TRAP transporter small permease [Polaromonas sp. AET17H-212]|uniref:TRAP transporter small permease n=1 Tax=Polaromonas sp. AET17H-212 TaxID=1977061 RepID=UPI001596A847|nr:TRAP transporter small permease [Polaromonas sp. AET17H-212]
MRDAFKSLDRGLVSFNYMAHMTAAFWLFAIAVLIALDVCSRALLNAPFSGTAEIVANSVVSIVFLQLPSAIRNGGMLRAEILDIYLSRRSIDRLQAFACILGAVLFLAVAYSAWGPMIEAWTISEFAGNVSTIEIPLAPIRTLLVAMSIIAAVNFLFMSASNFNLARGDVAHG